MQNKRFDIEDRSAEFAENVILCVRQIPHDSVNKRLIEQIVGSSGSIGANYCEANEAESVKDFIHKMKIARKEIRETKHWLRLLAVANEKQKNTCRELWKEADELMKIFSVIIQKKSV